MTYDLIIIGAGMSGISVGHFFRDRKVLILEKKDLAAEATGKNAGFIISGFGEHFRRTVERYGMNQACEIQRIHLANHSRIRELAVAADCSYEHTGSYAVAIDEKERSELEESCELMRTAGFAVQWIESPDVGLNQTCGALFNPDDGCLDSGKFWKWLAGDLPVRREAVTEIRRGGETYSVETTSGCYQTERVVYCLNAFSAELLPELQGRYIPLRGQMIETELRDAAPTRAPVYAQYGDLYWRFVEDRFIFGGLENRFPDEEVGIAAEPSPQIQQAQEVWIREMIVNRLVNYRAARVWCSTMAFTVDGFPFVGELQGRPGSYVLAGLCGLGHGYALECASWLHELIALGRNVIPPSFSSDRIGILPRYDGGSWRNHYEAWNY